ncbi:MAG TPA: nicotinic acid mononucleotide adenyltransferase [Flavobacteriaceae bacterium]|nr:nicotinic acid mononucleotide adenyltransferase [Flavobacteriaceae bacterium]
MKKNALILLAFLYSAIAFAQESKRELVKKGEFIFATEFHDNGIVSQEGYYNSEGKLHGTWTSYDSEGKKRAIAQYRNGDKVGIWYFYNGEELHEVAYSDSRIAKVVTWKDKDVLLVSNH